MARAKHPAWRPFGWQPYQPPRTARNRPLTNADANCGTGAGGFQPGNTCAGAGGVRGMVRPYKDTAAGLAEHLGIPSVQVDYNRHLAEGYTEGPEATPSAARVVESAERAGFRINAHHNRSDGGYNVVLLHPEGHELGVWLEKAIANLHNHDEANFELTFVPPANREGYAISREADQLTRAIHSAHFETASEAARKGVHLNAMHHHNTAVTGHVREISRLSAMKDPAGNVADYIKQHREAEGLHRIASDYHKERAGLQ